MSWTEEDVARRNREVLGWPQAFHPNMQEPPSELPKDLRPEWMIQEECVKLLQEDGWRHLRTDPVSDRKRGTGFGEVGMADSMFIRYLDPADFEEVEKKRWAEVIWCEWKSAKGKPAKKQLEWHQKERARGALTLIAGCDFPASVEGFRNWYKNSGLMRNAKW